MSVDPFNKIWGILLHSCTANRDLDLQLKLYCIFNIFKGLVEFVFSFISCFFGKFFFRTFTILVLSQKQNQKQKKNPSPKCRQAINLYSFLFWLSRWTHTLVCCLFQPANTARAGYTESWHLRMCVCVHPYFGHTSVDPQSSWQWNKGDCLGISITCIFPRPATGWH